MIVERAVVPAAAATMEEVLLAVTRENCETLIGKNVRVIVSADSKEKREGDAAAADKKVSEETSAEEKTSNVFFCTLFPEAFTGIFLVVVVVMLSDLSSGVRAVCL